MRAAVRERGFTLVELMVVLAIVGMASVAVVLNIPGSEDTARAEAERFGARLLAVRDRALFAGRPAAAVVDAAGYRFEEQLRGEWTPIADPPLGPERWDEDLTVHLPDEAALRIRFDAVGLSSPARIEVQGGTRTVDVTVSAGGEVRIDASG